jgi:dTDP-glucose 4,6-dehydratase/UDP-glucuronate decarboxylase
MKVSSIVEKDMEEIGAAVSEKAAALEGKRILITGGAGFLGYYLIGAVLYLNSRFERPASIVCLDNFIRGVPSWLDGIGNAVEVVKADVNSFELSKIPKVDYIVHAASIASPSFYRRFPIETMDANVGGLRNLLEYGRSVHGTERRIESFLFFSSSEIYGDPPAHEIPTKEDYRGNVSCTGPRACYDESKRYGETLCVNFHSRYGIPVKIVRPFNNYGPGMGTSDGRVVADFCGNILRGEDVTLFSDGLSTRTFCYVADAVTGYLLALLSDADGEPINIGADSPEVTIASLADMAIEAGRELFGIEGVRAVMKKNADADYLTDAPNRRCPSLEKARRLLGYAPRTSLRDGIRRTLLWHMENFSGGSGWI